MDHPSIAAHNDIAGNALAAYLRTLRRYNAFERESRSRVQAESFFDTRAEVGQSLGLGLPYNAITRVLERAIVHDVVYFPH